MLRLNVITKEGFDENIQEFVELESFEIQLEHSLASLSLWESKWEKPFLTDSNKTAEQVLDYIRLMTLNDVPEFVYDSLSSQNIEEITTYINSKHTATVINKRGKGGRNSEVVTSEIIYYWMVAHQIPFECQYWHVNRLMTLIEVCNIKNQPEKKMSKSEILAENKRLNEARRVQFNTKG